MSADWFQGVDPSIFPWWPYAVWARDHLRQVSQLELWQVMAAGGAVGVGAGLLVRAGRRLHRRPSTAHGSARWATTRELAPLRTAPGIPLGCLGRFGRSRLHAPARTHSLLISPTQGGKTSLLATELVRRRKRHAIIGDPKGGELYRMCADWQQAAGYQVSRFAPLEAKTCRINLPRDVVRVGTLDEWGDMWTLASRMLAPANQEQVHESATARYFRMQGTTLLTAVGLFILTAGKRRSFAGMLEAMSYQEKLLVAMQQHAHPNVRQIASAVADMDDRQQSGVWATAMSALHPYYNPRLAWATDETDWDWRGFARSEVPTLLYLCTERVTDLQEVHPLYRALMGQVLDDVTTPEPRPLPCEVLLDEFPHFGHMDVFETGITQLAGFGVSCTLAAQDLGQLWTTYGRQTAIWGNTVCKVFHTPAPGDETAQRLSEMLSEQTIGVVSTTAGVGRATVTHQETGRRLMTVDEISTMHPRRALLFVKGQYPARLWQATYHTDRTLRGRVAA